MSQADEKAKEFGATVSEGINWTHATGFKDAQSGREFVKWLDANNYETRGYHKAVPNSKNPNLRKDHVRYRC